MANRRLALARMMMSLGAERLLEPRRDGSLLVLNYHRLWPAGRVGQTAFDDGVFGPDVDEFRRQMQWLQAHTTVLDEEGLLKLGEGRVEDASEVYSAVTFDDGYADCHSLAKPVLDELGIRGIFFIPLDMIDTRRLGWWDLAAYMLKRTTRETLRIDGEAYDVQADLSGVLQRVLNLFKLRPARETAELLDKLSEASGVSLPTRDQQSAELMTWDQVRAMRAAGHGIGSHTLSHRVLATLDRDEQATEIRDSRRELEARLGGQVLSFAYPVGGPQHINQHSVALAREAGYAQAFTFNTGMATVPLQDRFRIPRESADSLAILKAKTLLPGFMKIRKAS